MARASAEMSARTSTMAVIEAAGVAQGSGGGISAIIVGEQRHLFSGQDAEFGCVALRGGGEHDAGAIVAGENQRAFECAGGEHHAAGADRPVAVARLALAGHRLVVRDTFEGCKGVVVVITPDGGARQQADVFACLEIADRLGGPFGGGHGVDLLAPTSWRSRRNGSPVRQG